MSREIRAGLGRWWCVALLGVLGGWSFPAHGANDPGVHLAQAARADAPVDVRRAAEREADALLDTRAESGKVYQVTGLRSRVVGTPPFLMGLFLDPHSTHWSGGVRNLSFGGEFLIRDPGRQELSFSLDWTNLSMPDGFWLQRGDPIRRAEWTELDARVLAADVGLRRVHALGESGDWQIFYGASLGVGVVFGEAWETMVDRQSCNPVPERRSQDRSVLEPGGACFTADGDPILTTGGSGARSKASWLWPVLPVVEVVTGLRYVIAEHYVLGAEFGFRTVYAFGGLTLGYQFRP